MTEAMRTPPDIWPALRFGFGPSPERNALCTRLGIKWENQSDAVVWSSLGMVLAGQQPEFGSEKRGKGRPRRSKGGIDYERAKHIKAMRQRLAAGETATDKALIDRAIKNRARLFVGMQPETLIASVTRGNGIWKDAERQIPELLRREQTRQAAGRLRQECVRLRSAANQWNDELEKRAANPLYRMLAPAFWKQR